MLEEAPIVPIYAYTRRRLVQTNVEGLYPNALAYHNFKHIRLTVPIDSEED